MLTYIEETLPPTMHLPVSAEDTLYFYRYLWAHVLIANRQFLLLTDIPIQDHMQQLSVYKNFILDIPHWNFTAWYDVNTPYIGVTQDETMAVEISQQQFSICQNANGQVCNNNTPLQPLANAPSCITALYTKNAASITTRFSLQVRKAQNISILSSIAPNLWILTSASSTVTTGITLTCPGETTTFITVQKPIHILCLPPASSATSPHFHLPPWYATDSISC